MFRSSSDRGFVFVLLLLLSLLLVILAGVVVARSRQGAHFQIEGQREMAALYAAEAGISEALARWSNDATKSWASDLDVDLPGGAHYSLRFAADQCVNNLNNAAPVAGPRGPHCVPPYHAYLVVTGSCQGRQRVVEALVTRAGLLSPSDALVSQNTVALYGDVELGGMRSLGDRTPIEADLVSLSASTANDQISWDGTGSLAIRGSVASNSSSAGAISASLPASSISGGKKINQGRVAPPAIDIPSRVSSAVAGTHTPVTLSGSSTTLGSGTHCLSSSGPYSGDIVLNGTSLYVDGDLEITGSIRGTGSVFVNGQTRLSGTTSIKASDSSGVALFSEGDVRLSGFNGTQFIRDLANDTGGDANQNLDNLRDWTQQMILSAQAQLDFTGDHGLDGPLVDSPPRFHFGEAPGTLGGPLSSRFNGFYGALAHDMGANYQGTGIPAGSGGPIRKLTALLEGGPPPGDSQQFLLDKFRDLRRVPTSVTDPNLQYSDLGAELGLFGNRHVTNTAPAIAARIQSIYRDGSTDGLLDFVNDAYRFNDTALPPYYRKELLQRVISVLETMNFDRPGLSYFQGTIYTRGDFLAENEVELLGGLYAVGPNSDVELRNGVWLTYVPEVVRQSGASLGQVGIKQWLRR